MGWVIRPDGMSVLCDKVNGSILYESIVNDLQCDWFTPKYRTKCAKIIQEIGIFKNYRESITKCLKHLSADADSLELCEIAKEIITRKRKIRTVANEVYGYGG